MRLNAPASALGRISTAGRVGPITRDSTDLGLSACGNETVVASRSSVPPSFLKLCNKKIPGFSAISRGNKLRPDSVSPKASERSVSLAARLSSALSCSLHRKVIAQIARIANLASDWYREGTDRKSVTAG